MKKINEHTKEMKAFGIQMLIVGIIALVLGIVIDQFILSIGSGIMLFIGLDMLRKSHILKKQQEQFIDSEDNPIMKVGTGYVAKGMDKLED